MRVVPQSSRKIIDNIDDTNSLSLFFFSLCYPYRRRNNIAWKGVGNRTVYDMFWRRYRKFHLEYTSKKNSYGFSNFFFPCWKVFFFFNFFSFPIFSSLTPLLLKVTRPTPSYFFALMKETQALQGWERKRNQRKGICCIGEKIKNFQGPPATPRVKHR